MNTASEKITRIGRCIMIDILLGFMLVGIGIAVGFITAKLGLYCRNFIVGGFYILLYLAAVGVPALLVWMFGSILLQPLGNARSTGRMVYFILSKIVCMIGIAILAFGIFYMSVLAYLGFAFSIQDEKTVDIDGKKYLAVTETQGWETRGYSYHKIVAWIIYEKDGWMEPLAG